MKSSCKKAEIVEVIKVVSTTGSGNTKDSPIKEVVQYWTKDGEIICEK